MLQGRGKVPGAPWRQSLLFVPPALPATRGGIQVHTTDQSSVAHRATLRDHSDLQNKHAATPVPQRSQAVLHVGSVEQAGCGLRS